MNRNKKAVKQESSSTAQLCTPVNESKYSTIEDGKQKQEGAKVVYLPQAPQASRLVLKDSNYHKSSQNKEKITRPVEHVHKLLSDEYIITVTDNKGEVKN